MTIRVKYLLFLSLPPLPSFFLPVFNLRPYNCHRDERRPPVLYIEFQKVFGLVTILYPAAIISISGLLFSFD